MFLELKINLIFLFPFCITCFLCVWESIFVIKKDMLLFIFDNVSIVVRLIAIEVIIVKNKNKKTVEQNPTQQ